MISTREGLLNIIFLLILIAVSSGTNHEIPESRRRRDTLPVLPLDDISDSNAVPIQRSPKSNIVKRSTANIVDLALFEESSPPGKQISVYVDETMTRLIIQVEVERSNPVIMVTKPSGRGPLPKLNKTTGTTTHIATIDTAITAADYGIWKIMKMDANKWNVKMQAESPLDFTYQFLEGTVFVMPVTGDPIQGETYTTVLTVPEYAKIQKIDMVFLFITAKSTSVNMMPATDKGGGKYEISLKVIDREFMIGIQGKDKSGNFFRRVTSLIKPVTLSLYVPPYAGVKLYENVKQDIEFSVVNKLKTDQDIDVRIQDTKNFAEAPVFISGTIKPGENFTGKFIIKGGLAGETTVVTITARQYLGFGKGFSLGPSEVRQFTVERNDTTTTSTTTSTTTPSTTTATSTSTSPSTPSKSTLTTTSKTTSSGSMPVTTAAYSASSITASTLMTTKKLPGSSTASPAGNTMISSKHASSSNSAITTASVSSATAVAGSTTGNSNPSVVARSTTASVATTKSSSKVTSLPAVPVTSSGVKATASAPGNTVSTAGGKTTTNSVTNMANTGSAAPAAVSSAIGAKNVGKTTTTAVEANDEEGDTFNKGEIFAAAIASGIATGVIIGVAALVTMGLVLKSGLKGKNSVAPDKKKNKRTLSEHNDLAWT